MIPQQVQQNPSIKAQLKVTPSITRMTNIGVNKDKPSGQTIQPQAATMISTCSDGIKQSKKKTESDRNDIYAEISDIQGTVGQLTGLQPRSGAHCLNINARLRLKETGSISANNRERTDPKTKEDRYDYSDAEYDQQTEKATLFKKQRLQSRYKLVVLSLKESGNITIKESGLKIFLLNGKKQFKRCTTWRMGDTQERKKKQKIKNRRLECLR
ncbi:MAG: hypothetical protein EZS28_026685 [Streblomastix strix]|uniref:Uncharacterized protein n=1 Tax=Streblomastix strix TaxID=222440 RepID=A0A5J4V4U8_9EUKA|nr:MAG: hypothetical protein EZS28_026685 [Streblomastix strix]